MIKRVVSLEDADTFYNSFSEEELKHFEVPCHFGDVPYNPTLLKQAWKNVSLLISDCIIVANFDTPNHIDGVIWFIIGPDYRTGKTVAQSYMWISRSPLIGIKLYIEAEKIIKKRTDIDYMIVGVLESSSVADKFEDVMCGKFGFKPESRSFYKKL